MAKSLRSKAKQHNKVLKRESVFGEAAAQREKRIAERLHQAAIDDILAKQESRTTPAETMEVEVENKSAVEPSIPSTVSKKSTGGWSKRKKLRGKKAKKSRK